jgi:hypothetical protein
MNRHYYVKTLEDGTIIDCISYEYENYSLVEVDFDGEVLLRGYYKLINGELVKDEVKEAEWLEAERKFLESITNGENNE